MSTEGSIASCFECQRPWSRVQVHTPALMNALLALAPLPSRRSLVIENRYTPRLRVGQKRLRQRILDDGPVRGERRDEHRGMQRAERRDPDRVERPGSRPAEVGTAAGDIPDEPR